MEAQDEYKVLRENRGIRHVSSGGGGVISGHANNAEARLEPRSTPSPAFSQLTSMSSGSRVILCMGRMRKEIMGRFLQSGWPSILVSTSLKTEFLELQQELERKLETKDGKKKNQEGRGRVGRRWRGKLSGSKNPLDRSRVIRGQFARSLTPASAASSAGRPRWSSTSRRARSWTGRAWRRCR